MSVILTALFAVPFVLCLLRLLLKRQQAKLPSWKDLDATEVLKCGGSKGKLEALSEVDVIVVGSGLGGLTAAVVLSKVGYKVVVLEQHDIIGGSTHTFDDGGYEFDVGIHYLGGQLDRFLSPVRRLFAAVSDGQLEWTKCDPNYDICHNAHTGESIPFCGEPMEDMARIAAAPSFAAQEGVGAAVARFRRASLLAQLAGVLMVAHKALPPSALKRAWPLVASLWRQYGTRTVAAACAECGMTGALAGLGGVVSYLYGDYGVSPRRAPLFLHAFVSSHYEGGAFFPTGGSSSIAKTLAAAIARRGGACLVRAPVSEILLEGGRAVGVVARGVRMRARVAVISDAGFRNTFGCSELDAAELTGAPRAAAMVPRAPLLPAEAGARQRAMLQAAQQEEEQQQPAKATASEAAAAGGGGAVRRDEIGGSIAMVYLFVGLDGTDAELGLKAQNTWVLRDFEPDVAFDHFDALELPDDGSILPRPDELPAVFVGAASAKDADWPRRHPGTAAVTVLAPVRAEWFERWAGGKIKNRGAEYKQVKAAWRELLLKVLYAQLPQLQGRVAYAEVGTPLSNDFYLGSVKGEVYGLDHAAERFARRDALLALHPQTSVPGLYLTGQDSLFVGVVSALMSGVFTATRVSYLAALRCVLEIVLS